MQQNTNQRLRVVVATNVMIHYTKNLCEEFLRNDSVGHFNLIITDDLQKEYTSMGMDGNTSYISYLIDARKDPNKAREAILNADLFIGQYCAIEWIRERVEIGKLTFIVSERIFKKYSTPPINTIMNIGRWYRYRTVLKRNSLLKDNVYFLAIGKFSAPDYVRLGVKKEHILNFAYFPEAEIVPIEQSEQECTHLLWVGRLVRWKHPEYAVIVCDYLRERGFPVDLIMIGDGEQENRLRKMIEGKEYIQLLGGTPTDEVRKIMKKSDVFLFTSNQGEGWGVVLNEAMSEGMVVVASESAGSTGMLVENGVNGFIYQNDSIDELEAQTELAIRRKKEWNTICSNAQKTILNTWNAKIAVKNLIIQYYKIKDNNLATDIIGPASSA